MSHAFPESDEVQNENRVRLAAVYEQECRHAQFVVKEMLEVAAHWSPGYQSILADSLTRAGKVLSFVATRSVE